MFHLITCYYRVPPLEGSVSHSIISGSRETPLPWRLNGLVVWAMQNVAACIHSSVSYKPCIYYNIIIESDVLVQLPKMSQTFHFYYRIALHFFLTDPLITYITIFLILTIISNYSFFTWFKKSSYTQPRGCVYGHCSMVNAPTWLPGLLIGLLLSIIIAYLTFHMYCG